MSRAGKRHRSTNDNEPKQGWHNPTDKPHLEAGQAKRIEFRSKQKPQERGWIHRLADEMRKDGSR